MNNEELARLMEVLENTLIVKLNDDYAVRIMDYVGPGEHDYTVVPILYRLSDSRLLEVWIEVDARQYRVALISEVDEHLKAVGGWLAKGELLVLFNDGLVKITIPKDSEPFRGFIRPG